MSILKVMAISVYDRKASCVDRGVGCKSFTGLGRLVSRTMVLEASIDREMHSKLVLRYACQKLGAVRTCCISPAVAARRTAILPRIGLVNLRNTFFGRETADSVILTLFSTFSERRSVKIASTPQLSSCGRWPADSTTLC